MENPPPVFRIYRLNWWPRTFALLFLGFSAFFLIGTSWGLLTGQEEAKPLQMVFAVVFLVVGIGLTINFFKTTITFTADAIELNTIFARKKLPFSGIRGRREYVVRGGDVEAGGSTRYLKLVPNDDRLPTLDFMKNYTFDDAFYRWFNALPDLDAEDNKVHKNANFGLV
jgi:hypothetical protein